MIQALQREIEAVVDPHDLMYLTDDDFLYVAKCTAAEIRKRREHNEKLLAARDNGSLYGYIMHEVASMVGNHE